MNADPMEVLNARLDKLDGALAAILASLANPPQPARQWYSVDEAAALLGKKPYTTREWCREGRLNAVKRPERRGGAALWSISADELGRYRNEGLLSPDARRNDSR